MFNKFLVAVAALLSLSPLQASPSQKLTCLKDCITDSHGFSLIRTFEGLRLFPYADAVGIKTVCFGHVIRPADHILVPMTGAACEALLEDDVKPNDKAINAMVKVPLTQNQVDALSDFTFNLGSGTLRKSSLLKKINKNNPDIELEFEKYVYAGGVKLTGLVYRRHAEAALYDSQ